MLIFWKLIFIEDRYLYHKSYGIEVNISERIYDANIYNNDHYPGIHYKITYSDKVINYCMGTLFCLCFLTSVLLNPFVIIYYSICCKTQAGYIFRLVAVSDLVTNCAAPLIYAYLMFHTKLFPSSIPILNHMRPFACIFGCISQFCTFILAVTRTIKVCFPFTHIRSVIIWCYLFCHVVYMIIVNVTHYVFEFHIGEKISQVLDATQDGCYWSYFLHCILGVAISMMTVAYLLLWQNDSASQKMKYYNSCVLLLYMNIPYIVTAISIIYLIWGPSHLVFNVRDVIYVWIPILTSALNPLILLLKKHEIYSKVAKIMKRRKVRTNVTHVVVTPSNATVTHVLATSKV